MHSAMKPRDPDSLDIGRICWNMSRPKCITCYFIPIQHRRCHGFSCFVGLPCLVPGYTTQLTLAQSSLYHFQPGKSSTLPKGMHKMDPHACAKQSALCVANYKLCNIKVGQSLRSKRQEVYCLHQANCA